MKKLYLILALIGFILPSIFVAKVSLETGNILLYTDALETFRQLFSNDISSAFAVDLFYVVILFLIWSYREAKKFGMSNWWIAWVLTFAFGLAGGLPFFLYLRQRIIDNQPIPTQ